MGQVRALAAAMIFLFTATTVHAQCPVVDASNVAQSTTIAAQAAQQVAQLTNLNNLTQGLQQAMGQFGQGALTGLLQGTGLQGLQTLGSAASGAVSAAQSLLKFNYNGQSLSLTSLTNLTGAFSPQAMTAGALQIANISAPGLTPPPTANFSTVSGATSWVQNTFSTTNTDSASMAAIYQRKNQALASAAQTGYALALNVRATAGDSDARAQALMQAGNSAQDMRGQLAALQASLTVLQGELSTVRMLRASQLEIQSAQALQRVSQ